MRRPMIDPQHCGDCFEANCFGCEVWKKTNGVDEDTDDDSTGDADD